jgi:hypothetical protein
MAKTPVGCDDEADGAGSARPLHAGRDGVAVAEPVQLKEEFGVRRDDLFDRLAGERRQSHHRSAGGGRACECHLAVGMHGLDAGRRDHDGK